MSTFMAWSWRKKLVLGGGGLLVACCLATYIISLLFPRQTQTQSQSLPTPIAIIATTAPVSLTAFFPTVSGATVAPSTRVPVATLDVMATATLFARQVQQTQTAEPTPTIFANVATSEPTKTPGSVPTDAPTQVPTPVPPVNTDVPVIATASPTDTPNPPPVQTQGQITIVSIFENGVVSNSEPDEYAEIANQSASPVNLSGWRLNAGDDEQDFYFPDDFVMQPGQTCRIYTNESHPETCELSFGSGQPVWRNTGDCGVLYNEQGVKVSERCY